MGSLLAREGFYSVLTWQVGWSWYGLEVIFPCEKPQDTQVPGVCSQGAGPAVHRCCCISVFSGVLPGKTAFTEFLRSPARRPRPGPDRGVSLPRFGDKAGG